jgi:RecB family exonuclease
MKCKFLGWDRPLLKLAADFLIANHTDTDSRLNLKHVTVVLPGNRACNRLEEILATHAAALKNKAWYPPEFLTLESLPEKFYKRTKKLANEMVRYFAWMEAMKRLDAEDSLSRKHLLPKMPTSFEARLALAKMLDGLHYELAAEGLDFTDVAQACREMKIGNEIARWNVLTRLQKLYANENPKGYLDEHDLWDIQAARLFAIEKQAPQEREKIRAALQKDNRVFYLVGLVDMNKLQKDILKRFDSFITPLVFAPETLKNRFDEFGCLRTEAWCETPIEIEDSTINIVLKPEHQADTMLREIAALGNDYSSGEIVIGVPDKQVIPFLRQRFAQADLPSRLVEGTSLKQTSVYRFLEVLLKFLKTYYFRDYAELVRHPDVELFLQQQSSAADCRDFIKQLDVFHKASFPVFIPESWKSEDERFGSLQSIWEQIKQLLTISVRNNMQEQRSLADWLARLKTILDRLYQDRQSQPQINEPLEMVLQQIESMKSSLQGLQEQFFFADALQLFLSQIETESIPPAELPGAIEMIGWLETAMDDAPVVIITGMNDGKIPSFSNSDMFLPDALRQKLELTDNRRRSARDAYYLNVLLETRKQKGKAVLIAGRRSTEGDPILPSRFFFASSDVHKVSTRVQRFFQEIQPDVPIRFASSLRPGCAGKHQFGAPSLQPPPEPIKRISVTAIKDYKECAYRFYLKHILHLKMIDDTATELGYDDFGTLIHEILCRFGMKDSPVRNSTTTKDIERFLGDQLDEYVRQCYGVFPMSTVEIQIERARERLAAFAQWQAEWRKSGYEIVDVELKLDDIALPIMIADIQLKGRIDRIDRRDKEFVVFDYKTSDSTPEEHHWHKDRGWINFQLPLYHYILRKSGYVKPDDSIRLGYMTMSKNVHNVRENMVNWDESFVQAGIGEAQRLVAELAACDWQSVRPAAPAPAYSQDFSFICHEDGF